MLDLCGVLEGIRQTFLDHFDREWQFVQAQMPASMVDFEADWPNVGVVKMKNEEE